MKTKKKYKFSLVRGNFNFFQFLLDKLSKSLVGSQITGYSTQIRINFVFYFFILIVTHECESIIFCNFISSGYRPLDECPLHPMIVHVLF